MQGRSRSTRHLTERAFLSLLRNWLLRDYVAPYCRSLGATRIFRRCYWIDALGVDSKTNLIEQPPQDAEAAPATRRAKKGKKSALSTQVFPPALQPIVALSQELAQESKPIALNGLILATGSSKRKEVRLSLNGNHNHSGNNHSHNNSLLAMPKESSILAASWLEAAPLILKEVEQSPAIFLLNPLGLTTFSYEDLAPLYQRTVPTELCLLIPHKQVEQRLRAAQRTPAHATALTALLRTDRWKTLPTGEEEASQALTGFIDLFIASLQRYFLLPVQRIMFPVATGPAQVENVPYTLIFATRRQDSLFSINDAISLHRRCVYEQSQRGVLGEEWFAQQQRQRYERAWQQLYQLTQQQGRDQRMRRWPDLRQRMLIAHFGQFTQQEYDAIILSLLRNQEVRCEWRQPSAEADGERIPGNEDTLLWR